MSIGMSPHSWLISTVLFFVLGGYGAFFTVKEFFDPEFSDWLSPGPGQPLLGDSGRMLMFEVGPLGIQTRLLGVQANILEGVLLGVGTIGVFMNPFKSNLAQFLTCALVPIEACYFLLKIVYFALTGTPELAMPVLVMGGGLMALSFWRLQSSLQKLAPASAQLVLTMYLVYIFVTVLVGVNMVVRSAMFVEDMAFFASVRDHFFNKNRMTWTKGEAFPDGWGREVTD